ncbi:VOC family protein [Pacificimonas sp. WHA3]|uniref:VOC family protein n=1 Tax=Pacificimonas pallii TaxID=2827236 RepID=A0ABS6SB86_9SPHN|nr:VOC family protein [Pacificimonas pallii]MBV7255684.1 VOC family protein [Pacificimonas pallii]
MFTHIMFGANDVEKARAFYDNALGALGIPPAAPGDRLFYGEFAKGGAFGVGKPANGDEATYANGGTVGFQAKDRAAVDAFHAAGLANGGADEGAPGPRAGAYGAYLRDPDGNKICAFCAGE